MKIEELYNLNSRNAISFLRHNKILFEKLKKEIKFDLQGDESISEIFYLSKNKIKKYPLCECGKKRKYVKFGIGYTQTCGSLLCRNKMASKNLKKTLLTKYNVNSPSKISDFGYKLKKTLKNKYNVENIYDIPGVIDKIKKTNKKKYGKEWSSQNDEIINKRINTVILKYGGKSPQCDKNVLNKTKKTNLKKIGYESNLSSPIFRNELKKHFIEKFGVDVPAKNKDIINKAKKTSLEKYGFESPSKSDIVRKKISDKHKTLFKKRIENKNDIKFLDWRNKNEYVFKSETNDKEFIINKVTYARRKKNNIPVDIYVNPLNEPILQNEIYDYIKTIYDGKILLDDKNILENKHIDIFLPDKKLGIEFDGLYWHCELFKEKNYHKMKTDISEEKGIKLLHIFEDEWIYKKDIVKSIIKNNLNIRNKIFARKCIVKEIDSETLKNFLNENHIQGSINSKIRIGLYYNNDLFSVMSFGTYRIFMNKKNEKNSFEMLRYCNKIGYSITGGASKMFNFFLKKYNPDHITTFSDRRWFNGNFYLNLGFNFVGNTSPNYYYVIKNTRKHRFSFRKDILIKEGFNKDLSEHDIMMNRKIYRIYDCGNSKYEWLR